MMQRQSLNLCELVNSSIMLTIGIFADPNPMLQTPQHYMPSENIVIGAFLRKVFQYIPSLLWLLRTAVFAYLETSGPQFNITAKGESLRNKACETSRQYVQANAPGKNLSQVSLFVPHVVLLLIEYTICSREILGTPYP